jgi:hypothetical protein
MHILKCIIFCVYIYMYTYNICLYHLWSWGYNGVIIVELRTFVAWNSPSNSRNSQDSWGHLGESRRIVDRKNLLVSGKLSLGGYQLVFNWFVEGIYVDLTHVRISSGASSCLVSNDSSPVEPRSATGSSRRWDHHRYRQVTGQAQPSKKPCSITLSRILGTPWA